MKYQKVYDKKAAVEKIAIEINSQWQMLMNTELTFLEVLNLPLSKLDELDKEIELFCDK